jgi:GH24 family phage-related lysozyme (muramidase)
VPSLEQLLRLREGVKTKVYLDSLKKPTVGIGHLVTPADNLKLGDEITDRQVSEFFKKDSAKALSAAKAQAAKAGIKDSNFIVYLASVNYQLGVGWNSVFKTAWKLILEGKYEEAAKSLEKTKWYRQTPVRVKDFQKALRSLKQKKGDAAENSAQPIV